MCTDAPNKRCFSWSDDVLQLRLEGMLIILVMQQILLKHYAIFSGNIIVKAVVKFSRSHVKLYK